MKDLMTAYAEAKFGKDAAAASAPTRAGLRKFVSSYFPAADEEVTGRLRAIRDAIEESIREEERLKGKALEAAEYAKYRTLYARPGGPLGWGWDIIRAAIPGLSPTAAGNGGIEKAAQLPELPAPPEPPAPYRRWYPAVQLGAATAGALLGRRAALRSPRLIEQTISRLAEPGKLSTLVKELLPRAQLPKDITAATLPAVAEAVAKSPSAIGRVLGAARKAGVKIPWKGKAALGALAVTAPFILYNLWKSRAVRARGGPEATHAARKAQRWLAQAEEIGKWRGQQLSQLETAGGDPGRYQLLPFS